MVVRQRPEDLRFSARAAAGAEPQAAMTLLLDGGRPRSPRSCCRRCSASCCPATPGCSTPSSSSSSTAASPGGASRAMLAGAAAGWVQDVHFGGPVLGLSGLTKVLVGFGVGAGSTRFHLAEPGARVLVLVLATVMDALIFNRLAAVFDVVRVCPEPVGPAGARGHQRRDRHPRSSRPSTAGSGSRRGATCEDLRGPPRAAAPGGRGPGGGRAAHRSCSSCYFWHLQVVRGRYFRELSENNRIRAIPIPAPRGPLFDRNGRILAENRSSFNVVLTTERRDDLRRALDRIATLITFDPAEVEERLNKRGPRFRSLIVKSDATEEDVATVEARRFERAGSQRGGRAPALLSPGGRRLPRARPRGRGDGQAVRAGGLQGNRGGHRRGPDRARAAVQPRAHGERRPAAHHREQPRGGGHGGGARGPGGRAGRHPHHRPGPAEGLRGGDGGAVGQRDRPRSRDRRRPRLPVAARLRPQRVLRRHQPRGVGRPHAGSREAAHQPRDPGRSTRRAARTRSSTRWPRCRRA